MTSLLYLFNNDVIAFHVATYPVSYLEAWATVFGLFSVYLAARANIWTWPTGIVNQVGFFLLFFQVQLYANMLLQMYFLVVAVYGWYFWSRGRAHHNVAVIHRLTARQCWLTTATVVVATLVLGIITKYLPLILPSLFPAAAAHPFADAFTTVASVVAMILLARKAIENWIVWIIMDIVSIGLYASQALYVVAAEFAVFMVISYGGFVHWRKRLGDTSSVTAD